MFENDRVLADGRKFDVEIFEARELFRCLRGKIDNEQVHSTIAIGDEIDFVVRTPHRTDVLGRIVGQILGRAGFEIMDPNIVGHAAAIMFPGPELAENAVERHFRIVRRKGRESAAWHRHLLRQLGIETDGEERTDEIVERFHPRAKDDQRFRVFPRHHDVIRSHSIRNVIAPERGRNRETFGRAAFCRHHINFAVAVVFRSERDLFSVRRKARERSVTGAARQAAGDAAIFGHGIKLARVTKNNFTIVSRRKTKKTRGIRQRLRRSRQNRQ